MEYDNYKVAIEAGQAEIVEKKSRFIAYIRPIESEEEALSFIDDIKKKNWDAKHNCYAYVIGKNEEITRCSDDGEPSGTAGRPMLEVLLNSEIRNIVVVVTRYFGGILLGTGGLVRAYQKAVLDALTDCKYANVVYGVIVDVTLDYSNAGKMISYCEGENLKIINKEYGENVVFRVFIHIDIYENFLEDIRNRTNGKALFTEVCREYHKCLDS